MLGSLSWDLRCVFYELYPDIRTYLLKRRKRSMSAETVIDSYDALSQSWSRCKSFLGHLIIIIIIIINIIIILIFFILLLL